MMYLNGPILDMFWDRLVETGHYPRVDHHKDGLSIYLPGVGKKNISVSDVGEQLIVEWKTRNNTEKYMIFDKKGQFDTEPRYVDGILYIKINGIEDNVKKIAIA